jgi:hypothetical protein
MAPQYQSLTAIRTVFGYHVFAIVPRKINDLGLISFLQSLKVQPPAGTPPSLANINAQADRSLSDESLLDRLAGSNPELRKQVTSAPSAARIRERSVRWIEPRLIATVKHFGRTGGALRAGVLLGLDVAD